MPATIARLQQRYTGEPTFEDVREVMSSVRPTEPVYLFSRETLKARARCFQQGFPGIVSYAVKANPEPRVIRALIEQGVEHFDVASIGEIETIASLHTGSTLHFNNPVKAYEAIATAYHDYGVRSFALDELAEFEKIRKATGGDREVLYSVRFKLGHQGASYDFGSKFGASQESAANLLAEIVAAGARSALTFHPGSQCTDPGMYAKYLQAAAAITSASGVAVEQVNVGGGFPEYYDDTRAPPLTRYFEVIEEAADTFFTSPPQLMCEPGRGMVGSAVSLLARIIHVREDNRSLFVNDGVYGGMQEQSLVDLQPPVKLWRNGRQVSDESTDYHVFGPTCDPIDRLSATVQLPGHALEDDYLEFGLLGAYGSATSTAFNGFRSTAYYNVLKGFRST